MGGAKIVPITQPFICMEYLQFYKKLFNVRINDGKTVITFVVIAFLGKLSSDVFTAFIPSDFEIFVYNIFTSSNTRYELVCTVSAPFSLRMKLL